MAQVGVEPTASLILSQSGLPIAYRAAIPWSALLIDSDKVRCPQVRGEGLEPS